MCDYCSQIKLVKEFHTPKEYEKTIQSISELIQNDGFTLIDGNCKPGKHKDEEGHWIDDIIFHVLKCPRYGQVYTCIVNTYRGGGSFRKGR